MSNCIRSSAPVFLVPPDCPGECEAQKVTHGYLRWMHLTHPSMTSLGIRSTLLRIMMSFLFCFRSCSSRLFERQP